MIAFLQITAAFFFLQMLLLLFPFVFLFLNFAGLNIVATVSKLSTACFLVSFTF